MGKQGVSRYRGVTRPGDGSLGWVAQKRGICYAARFTSEAKAAKWLAERLGVSVSSLRQTTLPGSEVRESYRGVVYHSGCWEARLRGGVVLGYFGSQDEAVRKLMRETGRTRKQLRKRISPRRRFGHVSSASTVFSDRTSRATSGPCASTSPRARAFIDRTNP